MQFNTSGGVWYLIGNLNTSSLLLRLIQVLRLPILICPSALSIPLKTGKKTALSVRWPWARCVLLIK